MSKLIDSLEIRHLHQACLLVRSTGEIAKVSNSFNTLTGWSEDELVGQNVSCLISPKIITVSKHAKLMKVFKLNCESKIVGKARVLPVKNSDDQDIFLDVQILPFGKDSKFIYLCFFGHPEIPFSSDQENQEILDSIITILKEVGASDDFRQNNPQNVKLVSFCNVWLTREIHTLVRFMRDNYHIEESWKYFEELLFNQKYGKLEILYECILKYVEKAKIAYTNLVCLRIFFPQLCGGDIELKDKVVQFSKHIFSSIHEQHSAVSKTPRRNDYILFPGLHNTPPKLTSTNSEPIYDNEKRRKSISFGKESSEVNGSLQRGNSAKKLLSLQKSISSPTNEKI